MLNEKIIETVEIDGVEFTIVEKTKTFYAGAYFVAPECNSEPDIDACGQWFEKNKDKIIDIVNQDCRICHSINYTTNERPCAILYGYETSNSNQSKGIHVMEAAPTILIKAKSTDAAWSLTKKLTGYGSDMGMVPLFFLIWHLFCDGGECKYERTCDIVQGNHDAEYEYGNGDKYVAVPVKRKDVIPEQWHN